MLINKTIMDITIKSSRRVKPFSRTIGFSFDLFFCIFLRIKGVRYLFWVFLSVSMLTATLNGLQLSLSSPSGQMERPVLRSFLYARSESRSSLP
jgi:hypothetical protein